MRSSLTARKIENAKTLDLLNQDKELATFRLTGDRKTISTYALTYATAQNIPELIQEFMATDLFDYVEPNFVGELCVDRVVPNDEKYSKQWSYNNDGSFLSSDSKVDADVDMDLAWSVEQGSSSITVAIIDTGVKLDHPEFSGRHWVNTAETMDGTDSDGNGYVDDINGYDFQNDDYDPTDDNGHGTAVAGIIGGGGNNSIGFAGIDWNCKLMHLKAMNAEGTGTYLNWIDAIYYAVDNGANVINMSVGSGSSATSLLNAINYAYNDEVTIVAASGNDNGEIKFPAEYANTIAVGSTDPEDLRSQPFPGSPGSGSCYGAKLNLVAPGSYIYALQHDDDNQYNQYTSGTSFSAPHVAGACALLLAQDPSREPDDLEDILQSSAEDQVGDPEEDLPGWDQYFGWGRLNIYYALNFESLGLDEKETNTVKLFPNPVKDVLHINTQGAASGEVQIINAIGQVVLVSSFDQSLFGINTAALPEGAYLVHVYNDSKELLASEKLIKE